MNAKRKKYLQKEKNRTMFLVQVLSENHKTYHHKIMNRKAAQIFSGSHHCRSLLSTTKNDLKIMKVI